MSARYLDARRCKIIADALDFDARLRGSEMTRDAREIVGQLESVFRQRSEPDSGIIVTYPGESE